MVRRSLERRYDRALSRALHEFGISLDELQSGRPIIGIAQTGSDLSPCNRHHIVLAERVREGIREAGGIAIEFPVHPIQETGKRPTAGLDRNLAYLSLVECSTAIRSTASC
jgi:dihydroxy-acid dehydratase